MRGFDSPRFQTHQDERLLLLYVVVGMESAASWKLGRLSATPLVYTFSLTSLFKYHLHILNKINEHNSTRTYQKEISTMLVHKRDILFIIKQCVFQDAKYEMPQPSFIRLRGGTVAMNTKWLT